MSDVAQILRKLARSPGLPELLRIWQERSEASWSRKPLIYQRLGHGILKKDDPLTAYDVFTEGLRHSPTDLRLQQLQALAVASSGAAERANAILRRLESEGHTDGETLGMLARTYKDLWSGETDRTERQGYLHEAHRTYYEGYRIAVDGKRTDDAIYTGINAASTALLLREERLARTLARQVRRHCLQKLKGGEDYWAEASLGEAAVLLERWEEARRRYVRAAELAKGNVRELASMRQQARRLLNRKGRDRRLFDRCFGIGQVVMFAGHMIDQPGRPKPRFPPRLEQAVRQVIDARLDALDAHFGYASAASGSDILFLEAMLARGAEIHVVLPFSPDEFRKTSVDIIPGANWRERFERVLAQATEVKLASEHRLDLGSIAYEYANMFLHGLASLRASRLDAELASLAVWDGQPGDGPGGTASIVARWKAARVKFRRIDPARVFDQRPPAPRTASLAGRASAMGSSLKPKTKVQAEIVGLLFADVVRFSRLSECEVHSFIRHFPKAVAELAATSPYPPVMKNTWGDGLYFVFANVKDAGCFALELCDRVGRIGWAGLGLPADLNLRIAVHAGPVYRYPNPIIKRTDYIGTHVNRAARIEPVTPPAQVYASEAFAALAAAQGVTEFTCEYVGQTMLAKQAGTFPIYHLRRRTVGQELHKARM
jgi:class 3 adenylate cyclase